MSTSGLLRSMKAKFGSSSNSIKRSSSGEENDKDASPAPAAQTAFQMSWNAGGAPTGQATRRQSSTNAADHRDMAAQLLSREAMLQAYRGKRCSPLLNILAFVLC